MNEKKNLRDLFSDSERLRWIISAAAVFVVFAILAIFFWDFLSRVIVLPIYNFFILARYGINSVPQGVFLILFVVAGIVIAIRSTSTAFREQRSDTREGVDDGVSEYAVDTTSRYHFWRLETGTLYRSDFARMDFARSARRLILEVLAHQEHRRWDEVEQMVLRNQLKLPPLIDELIRERMLRTSYAEHGKIVQVYSQIARTIGLLKDETDPVLDEHVNAIIEFIEQRLEILHHE